MDIPQRVYMQGAGKLAFRDARGLRYYHVQDPEIADRYKHAYPPSSVELYLVVIPRSMAAQRHQGNPRNTVTTFPTTGMEVRNGERVYRVREIDARPSRAVAVVVLQRA